MGAMGMFFLPWLLCLFWGVLKGEESMEVGGSGFHGAPLPWSAADCLAPACLLYSSVQVLTNCVRPVRSAHGPHRRAAARDSRAAPCRAAVLPPIPLAMAKVEWASARIQAVEAKPPGAESGPRQLLLVL